MHEGQGIRTGDNAAMTVATAIAKHDDIARPRRLDFAAALKHEAEITFLAPVQMPIGGIRTRIEGGTQSRIDKNPNDEHAAIDTRAVHVGRMMIWRADPASRLGDDCRPFGVFVLHRQ